LVSPRTNEAGEESHPHPLWDEITARIDDEAANGDAFLAGALYAPFAGFANTELLFWLLSGQVLIMVIVGGAGTLVGPIMGAVFFLFVQHEMSTYTDSWALFFGMIFILFVLFAPDGILGIVTSRMRQTRAAD